MSVFTVRLTQESLKCALAPAGCQPTGLCAAGVSLGRGRAFPVIRGSARIGPGPDQ